MALVQHKKAGMLVAVGGLLISSAVLAATLAPNFITAFRDPVSTFEGRASNSPAGTGFFLMPSAAFERSLQQAENISSAPEALEKEQKCCVILIGFIQLICTDSSTRQFYHFRCTEETEASVTNPHALADLPPMNATVEPGCCILDFGPLAVGCVAEDQKQWYHFMCHSGASDSNSTSIPQLADRPRRRRRPTQRPQPTDRPQPTPQPTPDSTQQPVPNPTLQPTPMPIQPTPVPPTLQPTPVSTPQPAPNPTPQPTANPTPQPTPMPVQPTSAPTPTANPQNPYSRMSCPGAVLVTTQMSLADYDAVVASIRSSYNDLSSICTATNCPQSDWAGCVLRMAGHDFMDFNPADRSGGSDGCIDFSDVDNLGLKECLYEGEHGHSIAESYQHHCTKISLADFLVIAAEAVMTFTRQHVIDDDPTRASMDFRSQFKYGRRTATSCSPSALPNPESSCTAVRDTFVQGMGLTWREAAALSGVHTLGRARIENSGYNGFWSDKENSRRFNNDYYVSMLLKGWGPETAVGGNQAKNQWRRIDVGTNEATLGKEMMLNTDLCLAFTMDNRGNVELDAATASSQQCQCTWLDPLRSEPSRTIYNGGLFCGSDGVPRGGPAAQRDRCCGQRNNAIDCGDFRQLRGPAAGDIIEFANDEQAWIDSFMLAWRKATENGFELQALR